MVIVAGLTLLVVFLLQLLQKPKLKDTTDYSKLNPNPTGVLTANDVQSSEIRARRAELERLESKSTTTTGIAYTKFKTDKAEVDHVKSVSVHAKRHHGTVRADRVRTKTPMTTQVAHANGADESKTIVLDGGATSTALPEDGSFMGSVVRF